MAIEMRHRLSLVVTSRALSCVGYIHGVYMFFIFKSYVSSDKLEGSSVMYSVVDKLIVECFKGAFVLVS